MTIGEILNNNDHRPWRLPTENWKFYQEWNNAIFLHWQVELIELQKFIPNELEIDLFEEKPWISLVAFTMKNIRLRNLPSFPPISNFDEVNVRTYVKSNNKPGVYFLSMEGGSYLSCKVAKLVSELPYRYSKIKRGENYYQSKNSDFNDEFALQFSIGKEVHEKSVLDKWLTERYVLYQDTETSINEFEIHHLEWPIRELEITNLSLSYPRFDKLMAKNPDKIQYSNGVKVLAWGKKKKRKTEYTID